MKDSKPDTRAARPGAWTAFWQTVTRFQAEKVAPWLGLRNALGLAIPLAAGFAAGSLPSGVALGTGALNVAFSDGTDPYPKRARRMLGTSVLVALAAFTGAFTAGDHALAIALASLWAFAAGILVALGQAAADVGAISLVVFIVFAAQPLTRDKAINAGLLAFAGGVFQTCLSLAVWPVRPHNPERHDLAGMYRELSRAIDSPVRTSQAPPVTTASNQAQISLESLPGDHSLEGERYRLLLSQAERIRLSLLTLSRLLRRIREEQAASAALDPIERFLAISSRLLASIGDLLLTDKSAAGDPGRLEELQALAEKLRRAGPEESPAALAMTRDARIQMDALAGQFRSAFELASHATPEGSAAFEREQSKQPWGLRIAGRLAKLRANLTIQSAACRHAIRLAACVAIGDALEWGLGWRRAYWIPMTIAIVLKPDFTSTFSRGALRLAGTAVGIVLATALFVALRPSSVVEIALIGALTFLLRGYGPANYGIVVTAVTGLVVLLIAVAGMVPGVPTDIIEARGINTAVGGAIALAAYAIWPTWERTQVSEAVAAMLDTYRDYFRVVREGYLNPGAALARDFDRTRLAGRLARSNLEASIDRLGAEPGTSAAGLNLLTGMLASSHRLAHSMIALEAGLAQTRPAEAREGFRTLANHMELTLYSLAAALRGSPLSRGDLPDLREDHHALVAAGHSPADRYALVNAETDRLTNSLNTLTEEILRWRDIKAGG